MVVIMGTLPQVEVRWNRFVVLNWMTAIGLGVLMFFVSFKALVFLFLSLMFSQGLHPANARQLQRHLWDGSDDKVCAVHMYILGCVHLAFVAVAANRLG
jgi:hypothetical protein